MMYRSALLAVLLLVACNDDESNSTATTAPTSLPTTANPTTNDPSGTSGNDPTGTSAPTSTTAPVEGAPVFLDFSASGDKITEGGSVIITAILTDPDGVDDIVGGSLKNEDGSVDFGPFMAAGQPGTYSITLTWAQLHEDEPIQFENTQGKRVVFARFFDQMGHEATKSLMLGLQCPGGSACGGSCTDLALDGANCGTCGHVCAAMACEQGGCAPTWSPCVGAADGLATCAEACQSFGESCVENRCGFGNDTVQFYISMFDCMNDQPSGSVGDSCDFVQGWAKPAIKCCCTDSN